MRTAGLAAGLLCLVLTAGLDAFAQEPRDPVVAKVKNGMALIPAGDFLMGCSPGDGECEPEEKPAHMVSVGEFLMDVTEVTVAAYRWCVDVGRCRPPRLEEGAGCTWGVAGKEKHPVNCVDWNQAKSYCEWAGKQLPTGAEWEKAARGVSSGARYGDIEKIAWFEKNAKGSIHPSGRKTPNAYGLHDMLGNAAEWSADRPEGLFELRGGSWSEPAEQVRVSRIGSAPPFFSSDTLGFRCVVPVTPAPAGSAGSARPHAPAPPADPWREYAPEGAGFTVMMPGVPEVEEQTQRTPRGEIVVHTYGVWFGDAFFAVMHTDLPAGMSKDEDVERLLDGGVQGAVQVARLVSQKNVELDGRKGREIVAERNAQGLVLTLHARIYAADNRIFSIIATAEKGSEPWAAMKRFLESFHWRR
jgi:hypothetical protein